MIKKTILIATGGTGGHIFPAYSLANYLIKEEYNVKLTTDQRGLSFLKDYKNLNLIKMPSSPLIRKNFFIFLISMIKIINSTIRSFFYLLFNRPSMIIGMGGYSSFPICFAAYFLKIKFIIYESNLIIGKANRYLLPFAKKVFVSYKELEGISQKHKNKIIEIGNLVREEIINFKTAHYEMSKLDKMNILILGGSQGAKIFSEELPEIFKELKKNNKLMIKIYHQCQKNQNDKLSEFYQNNKIDYEIFNFTNKIIDYYQKVNLVITRSGASVLGELINVNIPFISIPLPSSADNHQHKNAEFYEKKGYGFLLREKDIKNKLYDLINLIFKDESLIKNIISNQKKYSDKYIFKNVHIQIKKELNEKN